MHIRSIVVTAFFAIVFAVLANLAWITGVGATGPWFSPTVSMQTYTVSLVAAGVLAVLVASVASGRLAALDEALRALDLRVAAAKDATSRSAKPAIDPNGGALAPPEDNEIDELLEAIGGFEPAPVVTVERSGHDSLLSTPAPPQAVHRVGAEALREIHRQRLSLRAARSRVWRLVAGPLLASAAFVAISGAMLPGSEGFAAAQYQLNTALVLFLGYGWAPLVAWSAAVVLMMQTAPPKTSE